MLLRKSSQCLPISFFSIKIHVHMCRTIHLLIVSNMTLSSTLSGNPAHTNVGLRMYNAGFHRLELLPATIRIGTYGVLNVNLKWNLTYTSNPNNCKQQLSYRRQWVQKKLECGLS
ncbi:uncharacterized protein LOC113336883 isoform X1 [Papaver somniferum]|uniref:uncharacterized protein LOC113336883 isoform X1 n=1 Tax=Papaver somniferum TaxID=3469 RepID=UPI000E703282|nr:uncharacterized protein LOC113336883 isoform X1 [Papaver somniferum]